MPLLGIKGERNLIISFENTPLWVRSLHAGFMGMQYKYNRAGAVHACHALKCPSRFRVQWCCVSRSFQVDLFFWLTALLPVMCEVFTANGHHCKLVPAWRMNVTSCSLVEMNKLPWSSGLKSKQNNQSPKMKQQRTCMLLTGYLFDLHSNPEAGDMCILRNIG